MYISAERSGNKIIVWERHADDSRTVVEYPAPYYLYAEDKENGNKLSLYGHKVTRFDFDNYKDLMDTRRNLHNAKIRTFESDVKLEHKVLSQHYYGTEAPTLNVTFLDIEVDYSREIGFASCENPYAPINSVALYHQWSDRTVIIAVPPKTWGTDPRVWEEKVDPEIRDLAEVFLVENEYELLFLLLREIKNSDMLSGWNSDFFDMPYICKRIEISLGSSFLKQLAFEGGKPPRYAEVERFKKMQTTVISDSRIFMDYLQIFKKFEMDERHSYSLESISEEFLELPKLHYEGTLAELYTNDFNMFMRYNIRDTECLRGFEEQLGYAELAVQMYHSSTGVFNNVGGTIKLAELSIMNFCHNVLDVVVPDTPPPPEFVEKAQGAFVLTPKAGLHKWIGSVDIASLYPSAIRTVNISPETMIGQFTGKVEDFDRFNSTDYDDFPAILVFEDKLTGRSETQSRTIGEWKNWLRENQCAISGYGTVFDQKVKGVIPSILEEWFATRKKYKNEMGKYNKQLERIKEEVGLEEYKRLTIEDPDVKRLVELSEYNDRLQYCYKIKLNSTYGALLNKFFKYFDQRLGESTTGTGRAILRFMCGETNEVLTGIRDSAGEAVVYGDTDSCYFSIAGVDDIDSAVNIADNAAAEVNSRFQGFVKRAFFATEEFSNHVKAEREVVAKAGIFVTRKRYVLNVVDDEGKKVDKLKIMGLDIKKTIIPKFYQKKLAEFIGRFLRGENWDDVARDVVNLKRTIREEVPLNKLGVPKGIQKLEFYTGQYDRDPLQCRLPGHVAASIHYNAVLDHMDDKDSMRINSGDKIYIFYLKNCYGPRKRFKSIAMPVDIKDIPDWFTERALPDIDIEAQLHRLVDKPLHNILKVIGEEPPTAQTVLANDSVEFM